MADIAKNVKKVNGAVYELGALLLLLVIFAIIFGSLADSTSTMSGSFVANITTMITNGISGFVALTTNYPMLFGSVAIVLLVGILMWVLNATSGSGKEKSGYDN